MILRFATDLAVGVHLVLGDAGTAIDYARRVEL